MSAGQLDRRIVLQIATVSQDPTTGQEIQSWDQQAVETWAQWLPASAREVWQARQIDATIEGAYKIYDVDPRPTPETVRILGHDGRLYDLKGVTEIGREDWLMLAVTAKATQP